VAERRARRASPARSQHFLRDSAVAAELVRLGGVGPGDLVIEVGAGDGAITAELARRAGYVVAIEIDPALARRLRRRFQGPAPVVIVEGDVVRQGLPRLPFRVVSNVPFAATTRVLRMLLDDPRSSLEQAALLVQWEVALKRARERPSTLLGLSWAPWWNVTSARRVPATAFSPPPSVDGGIVVVRRRTPPLLPPAEAFQFRALVRTGFSRGMRCLITSRQAHRLGLTARTVPTELGIEEWLRVYRFLRPAVLEKAVQQDA
jgi:23S rRNA (adenine-N6)-dimethyltransferase